MECGAACVKWGGENNVIVWKLVKTDTISSSLFHWIILLSRQYQENAQSILDHTADIEYCSFLLFVFLSVPNNDNKMKMSQQSFLHSFPFIYEFQEWKRKKDHQSYNDIINEYIWTTCSKINKCVYTQKGNWNMKRKRKRKKKKLLIKTLSNGSIEEKRRRKNRK